MPKITIKSQKQGIFTSKQRVSLFHKMLDNIELSSNEKIQKIQWLATETWEKSSNSSLKWGVFHHFWQDFSKIKSVTFVHHVPLFHAKNKNRHWAVIKRKTNRLQTNGQGWLVRPLCANLGSKWEIGRVTKYQLARPPQMSMLCIRHTVSDASWAEYD